jgi:hypothetical protein
MVQIGKHRIALVAIAYLAGILIGNLVQVTFFPAFVANLLMIVAGYYYLVIGGEIDSRYHQ